MKLLVALAILIFANQSIAASICSDLAAQTCAQGEHNDGTGVSSLTAPFDFMNSEILRINPKLKIEFSRILSGNAGADLRQLAITAYKFEQEPDCQNTGDNVNCLDLISDQMFNTYIARQFGGVSQTRVALSNSALAELHLVSDLRYLQIEKSIADEQKALVPKSIIKNIEQNVYPKVLALLKARIRSLPIAHKQKNSILNKIGSVKFAGADCTAVGAANSQLAQAFLPNAFYNPENNTFAFCLGYLRISTSEFNIVHTIAHELSHSIDPCSISSKTSVVPVSKKFSNTKIDDSYLRKNFISCLRSSRSAGAKHFQDDAPLATNPAEGSAYNDTARLCGKDQINETVADWFAAEIVSEYSENHLTNLSVAQKQAGFANIMRPTCLEVLETEDRHPSAVDRINGILLTQPKLRAQMGCDGDVPNKNYCSLDNPELLKEKPLKSGSESEKNRAVK
jgi:hypothetical protein